jgi:hypothetical protein
MAENSIILIETATKKNKAHIYIGWTSEHHSLLGTALVIGILFVKHQ